MSAFKAMVNTFLFSLSLYHLWFIMPLELSVDFNKREREWHTMTYITKALYILDVYVALFTVANVKQG